MDSEIMINLKSYPKTSNQWWAWLDIEWDNTLKIIKKFTKNKTTIKQIIDYKMNRNIKIKELLEDVWELVPNLESNKKIPGWIVFSELISEMDILEFDQSYTSRERNYFVEKSV